jgi:hypothetical protein
MQHLNVLPDWDMFQTDHEFSRFHAAARCLSGGPIYITDVPGKHDIALIDQMTAKTPDGRLIILRPEKVGHTSDVYVAQSEHRLLTIQTQHAGAAVLGIFNVTSSTLCEFIHLDRFGLISTSSSYIVRCHTSGRIMGPYNMTDNLPMTEVTLGERCYEIMTAYPITAIGDAHVAVLGLLGKMATVAALRDVKFIHSDSSSTVEIQISLKGLGVLGTDLSIYLPWGLIPR